MNEMIKNSIDARKQAIFNAYNIDNKEIEKTINDFFTELEKFASKYNDVMDFETAFSSSDLNQKYINLFTEVGSKCKPKVFESEEYIESTDNNITSDAQYLMDDLTQPMRREARQKVDDALRSTPIVGDIMGVKQHIDLFNKFKKNNKDGE